ncbi:S8 family serine peptidase [Micromonospora terminaliae]|uniref:S8 family serine peptidase n=1 Tax=Micromonospora terminaliae TaxID=1914461 RepID=A0AAJ2ZEF6_9ACTN|nr:S8 family serine peptidase [Micromonospora terminaliae]NES27804.1 S8 family serine peptidase [Micromonospora terminaliae]QGL47415.1 S8 family serine peptidase [Micromonospora terminaliae]
MRRRKIAWRGSVTALVVVAAGLPATGALAGPDGRPAGAQGSHPEDCAQLSYPEDPGFVARSPGELDAAKTSWETPEYGNYTGHNPSTPGTAVNSPWQLTAVNASTAYALGYCGQGVTLGMMDSGYRPTHEAFQTELIEPVRAEGVYGTSGYGYRGATPANPFTAGEWFTVAGDQARTSDYSHGNGMLGVTSGMRDGIDQHGIAFGSKMYVAKTGGSDSQSHGPFHDYVYWYTANKALVDAGAQVINSSWGSYVQTLDRTRYDGLGRDLGVNGNLANAYQVAGKDSASATAMATIIPNEHLKDLEYQYFFFKKSYSEGGIQYNPDHPGRSFMDAIWDAIKDSGTVNARSAGNNDWSNPYFRPAYPLFNPSAEKQWIAVGGVQPPTATNPEYTKQFGYNEAGLAKWWNVSTPSNNVRTTSSSGDTNYSNSSGTSPATPVATSVMGVLLSRYPDMDAKQVRELMLTTANNKMSDGVRFLGTGQTSPSGESIAWTAPDGLPDERWGWGIPDLAKGMYGPGQLLSPMTYNMDKAPVDVWSNDIGQIAIKEREREDREWLAGYQKHGIAFAGEFSPNVLHPDGTLDDHAFMLQGILADPQIQAITNGHPERYDKITYADAVKWRKEWMDQRAAYIQNNIDNNLYTASLTKQGPGTLIMTGDETYEGGTTVDGGKLSITGSHASSIDVKGGTLGGSGSVGDRVTVTSGVLRPGLTPDEAAKLTGTSAGNVLTVGGNVTVGGQGRVAVTISGDTDYTSVRAAGQLVLGGELDLDVRGKLTPGTVFTIMSGSSITGAFHALPENRALNVGGHLFRVSYQNNSVTLTVLHPVPNNGK